MINSRISRNLKRGAGAAAVAAALLAGTVSMATAAPAHSHGATPAVHQQTTGGFTVSAHRMNASAGHNWVRLTFTNVTQHPIHSSGWAGVSFVGHHDGTQLGKPASWTHTGDRHHRTVKPGNTMHETVRIANPGAMSSGKHVITSDGFRVYAPHSTASVYVPFRTDALTKTKTPQLAVRPVF